MTGSVSEGQSKYYVTSLTNAQKEKKLTKIFSEYI
jgi:hypothetical protein